MCKMKGKEERKTWKEKIKMENQNEKEKGIFKIKERIGEKVKYKICSQRILNPGAWKIKRFQPSFRSR